MYDGPGIYKHFKGGHYRVLGVGRTEVGGHKFVVYHSYNIEHDLGRWMDGADFVLRPLEPARDADAFDDLVPNPNGGAGSVPRFYKVSK